MTGFQNHSVDAGVRGVGDFKNCEMAGVVTLPTSIGRRSRASHLSNRRG